MTAPSKTEIYTALLLCRDRLVATGMAGEKLLDFVDNIINRSYGSEAFNSAKYDIAESRAVKDGKIPE